MKYFLSIFISIFPILSFSQEDSLSLKDKNSQQVKSKSKSSGLSIKGYAQIRFDNLFATNPDLSCSQCDQAWGGDTKFSFRRLRPTFYGNLTDNISYNIQPDFATSVVDGKIHSMELKNAYFDIGFDSKNEFRIRLGQSKIPFGMEIMQSSSNRITLDRSDGINSAFKNERDLGVFFYWTPESIQKIMQRIKDNRLSGYGNYGIFGFGVFNGQTANRPEINENKHIIAKVSYPFEFSNQIFELSVQGYTGKYLMPTRDISNGVKVSNNGEYLDQRAAISVILYPQPFGIFAEYNIGRGPEFNKSINSITLQNLNGGFILFNYKFDIKSSILLPYMRFQYYDGGKKHELDARSYTVKEIDLGIEWQASDVFELTAEYNISNRRYEDYINRNNHRIGNLLRLQAQINY